MKYPRSCVINSDFAKYRDKTLEECKVLCEQNKWCKALEYYFDYGGTEDNVTGLRPQSCWLQLITNHTGCDGARWNKDLYIKGPCQGGKCIILSLILLICVSKWYLYLTRGFRTK